MSDKIKLTIIQKEIIKLMRKGDAMVMKFRDGCWLTGGGGKVHKGAVNALIEKGIIGAPFTDGSYKLTKLGKTIKL